MKRITSFIKRNMPIFLIGLVTMLVFVGIIILSERSNDEPALKIVNESDLIAEHNYYKGPADADVVLVEFSDFECPACAIFHPVVNGLSLKYKDLKIVYRHYPLPQHPNAESAARASMAAGEQDAFWEYHDLLFENQNTLGEQTYVQLAKDLGLDEKKFMQDYKSEKIKQYVAADKTAGETVGVDSTPTFYLNGRKLELKEIADLEKAIIEESKKKGTPLTTELSEEAKQAQQDKEDKRAAAIDFGDGLEQSTMSVSITDEGIDPVEIEMKQGQDIEWTNETDKVVVILPKFGFEEVYPELKTKGISVPAKGTATFNFYKIDRWAYQLKDTMLFGYVYPL